MTNTNENKTFNNSVVEFSMGNVRVAKEPVVQANKDGSHRVTLMVSAGENRCYFLQDYVKPGVDPNTSRLATRVVGEALNVNGYLDGHVYDSGNGNKGYALSCNVTRVIYLTSKDERNNLVAKRAAAAQQPYQVQPNVPQQAYAPAAIPQADADGFMNIPDGLEENLPFA